MGAKTLQLYSLLPGMPVLWQPSLSALPAAVAFFCPQGRPLQAGMCHLSRSDPVCCSFCTGPAGRTACSPTEAGPPPVSCVTCRSSPADSPVDAFVTPPIALQIARVLSSGTGDFDSHRILEQLPKDLNLPERRVAATLQAQGKDRKRTTLVQAVSHLRQRKSDEVVKSLNNLLACNKVGSLPQASMPGAGASGRCCPESLLSRAAGCMHVGHRLGLCSCMAGPCLQDLSAMIFSALGGPTARGGVQCAVLLSCVHAQGVQGMHSAAMLLT